METLIKKLSMAKVMGKILPPEIGDTIEQYKVFGYARRYETRPSTYGDSTRFDGDFKGINTLTGECFRAPSLFLPSVAESLLRTAIDGAGDGGVVEFGFSISIMGVKCKVEGETGKYEYRVIPLTEPAENDPLEALQKRIASGEKMKALPKTAPAAVTTAPGNSKSSQRGKGGKK